MAKYNYALCMCHIFLIHLPIRIYLLVIGNTTARNMETEVFLPYAEFIYFEHTQEWYSWII